VVATPCVHVLLALYPGELPRGDEIRLDGAVLAGAAAFIAVTAVVSALPLLRRIRRIDLTRDLRGSARSTASREQRRVADVMVGVQVALSVALLFGAALLLRAYRSISAIDPGFRSEGVATFRLVPAPARYPDAERRTAYFDRVLRSIHALPAVESVGASMFLPLVSGGNDWEDRPRRDGIDATFYTAPLARIEHVTPGYFETLGIPLLRGRPVDAAATDSSFRGVWVNQAYATRAFGTPAAIGRQIVWEGGEAWPIVGIVGNATHGDLWSSAPPTVYFPIGRSSFVQERWIVVRTSAPAEDVLARVRAELRRIDPTVAPAELATMAEREARARAPERFRAALLGVLTCVAVLLAIVGLYSSVAVAVGRRTREIGLRLALGETRGAVRRRVLRQALAVAGAGTLAGCLAGLAGKQWLGSFLTGVDGGVQLLLAVAVFLLSLAAVAAAVPAARASRVDPAIALRGDG
jgi:putative ABC transport system permease protein